MNEDFDLSHSIRIDSVLPEKLYNALSRPSSVIDTYNILVSGATKTWTATFTQTRDKPIAFWSSDRSVCRHGQIGQASHLVIRAADAGGTLNDTGGTSTSILTLERYPTVPDAHVLADNARTFAKTLQDPTQAELSGAVTRKTQDLVDRYDGKTTRDPTREVSGTLHHIMHGTRVNVTAGLEVTPVCSFPSLFKLGTMPWVIHWDSLCAVDQLARLNWTDFFSEPFEQSSFEIEPTETGWQVKVLGDWQQVNMWGSTCPPNVELQSAAPRLIATLKGCDPITEGWLMLRDQDGTSITLSKALLNAQMDTLSTPLVLIGSQCKFKQYDMPYLCLGKQIQADILESDGSLYMPAGITTELDMQCAFGSAEDIYVLLHKLVCRTSGRPCCDL